MTLGHQGDKRGMDGDNSTLNGVKNAINAPYWTRGYNISRSFSGRCEDFLRTVHIQISAKVFMYGTEDMIELACSCVGRSA